jgi:hypothetical protein
MPRGSIEGWRQKAQKGAAVALADDHRPDFPSFAEIRGRTGLIVPAEVTLNWPPLPGVPLLQLLDSDGSPPEPEQFLRECVGLAAALAPEHGSHAPSLGPWSLRWDDGKLLACVLPGAAHLASQWSSPFHEPVGPIPANDLYVVGVLLFRVLTGRWPHSRADALAASGVLGGEWPLGADVAVRLCLNPDPADGAVDAAAFVQSVQPFIERNADADGIEDTGTAEAAEAAETAEAVPGDGGASWPADVTVTVAQESVTGWQKAVGRPGGDNEDAVGWTRTATGTVGMVLDGVTGDGAGGGRWAAHGIRDAAARAWSSEVAQPAEVLDVANKQLGAPPAELPAGGAAVGVAALVDRECRLSLASLGDCPAFLCRPAGPGFRAARLVPEDSVVAEKLRLKAVP